MSTPIGVWLHAAELILGRPDTPEDEVDALIDEGLEIDVSAPANVDPVQLERVLAVLRARAAVMASEIADLNRRRTELIRAQLGTTVYLNS
jgi:hypothetical protein